MKFKFKFRDALLLVATLSVFILSIVLWVFVMSNDQYFSHINQANNVTQHQIRGRRNKSVYDLYMPTSSYQFEKGQLCRLYDSKNNLSLEFTREIRNVKFSSFKKVSTSPAKYDRLLNNPNFLQLAYPDEITVDLFNSENTKNKNHEFRRIFISASNKWFYAANDKTNTIYRIGLKKADFSTLRRYAKNAKNKTPIKFVRLKSGYSEFYLEPTHWHIYSYLTNTQSDSYFVSRLLGTAKVAGRTTKNKWTTYSLNYYNKLRVPAANNDSNNFLYTRYEKVRSLAPADYLVNSVYYVHRIGLSEQDLRFFDADSGVVSYTNYVEGIPVFLNRHDVQVRTDFSAESVLVAFNSVNLQIPIPFDGQTRTLPSTESVVDQLTAKGLKRSDIQRIIVGCGVEKDSSRSDLVNLLPTYYLKIAGQWRSLAEWEKQDFSLLEKSPQRVNGVK